MTDESNPAIEHGGSLAKAEALFPHAPRPFVDLSTGINPHPYPHFDLPASALNRLPEPSRIAALCEAAAKAYGAPSADHVAAGPGTQLLLPFVYGLIAPGRVAVLGPTYQEHAHAARIAGHSVEEVNDVTRLAEADLAIVVNPNNPDGRVASKESLLALAAHMRAKGGLLVVDEAFMEVGPRNASLAGDVTTPGLVVLRSFGKFYGLAGLRLGFALADPATTRRLNDLLGPWAVAGPALEYGLAALADTRWQEATRARLADEIKRLNALFERASVDVVGGTDLYLYMGLPQAADLYRHLGRHGVVLRSFADRSERLRCGLPGTPEEWQRLETALALWPAAGV